MMKIVVQRTKSAQVFVDDQCISSIDKGFLLLVAIEQGDTLQDLLWCAKKVSGLRIFDDEMGKMNLNLEQVNGSILSVSQFTLAGDVNKGNRPSFVNSERAEIAKEKFEIFNQELRNLGHHVEEGKFQAMMDVKLVNDGPVTLIIESKGK